MTLLDCLLKLLVKKTYLTAYSQLVSFALLLAFALSARAAPGDVLFFDNFNSNLSSWSVFSSGGGNASIGNETSQSGRSLRLRFDAISIRSNAINAAVPAAELSMWIRRGDDAFSEDPDAGENFEIHYLDDNGSWSLLDSYPGAGTSGEIITPTYTLPVNALHSGLEIRLTLTQGNGAPYDYWHIDNLQLIEVAPPSLQVCSVLFQENFNTDLSAWTIDSSGGGNASIGTETAASGSSLRLRFDTVSILSPAINAAVSDAQLTLWIRRGDDIFSEDPDANEDLVIEYLNDSSNWVTLDTFAGNGTTGQIYTPTYTLPSDALHAGLQIRLSLTQASGFIFDYWHVDDVFVFATANSCGCSLGSFDITQAANALACPSMPAAVSIQAMCDDGITAFDDYQGTFTLTSSIPAESQFFSDSAGTIPISSYTINSGENGQASVYLYHQNAADDVRVTVNDTAQGISSTASAGTRFATAGFSVSSPSNVVCLNEQSITITAIGQTDTGGSCAVLSGFSGNYPLKSWFEINVDPTESPAVPDISATPLLLNGVSITQQSLPAANNLAGVSFVNGVATIDVRYDNVAEMLGVHFVYDEAPYDGLSAPITSLLGSVSRFVVSPASVAVLETDIADGSCVTDDENCTPFKAAGESFAMTATALCADNVTVASQYQGNVALTHTLIAPAAGDAGTLSIPSVSIVAADNGIHQLLTQQISEVGVFSINTQPENYFGAVVASGGSPSIGRFYPDHFIIQSPILTNRVDTACVSSFTYMDEILELGFSMEAKNASADTVSNYTGNFALLDDITGNQYGELSIRAVDTVAATPLTSRISSDLGSSILWSNGIATVVLRLSIDRLSTLVEDGSYENVIFSALPSDGDASVLAASIDTDSDVDTVNDSVGLAGTIIYAGRLRGANAFGPESQALVLPLVMERYVANTWETNVDDNCTNVSSGMFDFNGASPPPAGVMTNIPVGTASTDAAINNSPAVAGSIGINLTAPGAGGEGSVDVNIDITTMPWLQFDWDGDGMTLENPPVFTGSFGFFRGNDRVIYRREILQ